VSWIPETSRTRTGRNLIALSRKYGFDYWGGQAKLGKLLGVNRPSLGRYFSGELVPGPSDGPRLFSERAPWSAEEKAKLSKDWRADRRDAAERRDEKRAAKAKASSPTAPAPATSPPNGVVAELVDVAGRLSTGQQAELAKLAGRIDALEWRSVMNALDATLTALEVAVKMREPESS
jgi:hypothetical protein